MNVFPNDCANSIRFSEHGVKRVKILKFHGVNYKKLMN
jgi:hypothetical protein